LDNEYYEEPLFVHVNKEGSVSLEWISDSKIKKDEKRVSLHIDCDDIDRKGPLEIYAIITGPGDYQELFSLTKCSDLKAVMDKYFSS
jgi:hypothetical protein